MLTGSLEPDTGKIVIGETVKFGYYTQKGMNIKAGQKVIEVVREFGDYIPLKKGKQIYVEGRLQTRQWDDKDGNKRYTTEVKADRLTLLGGGPGRSNAGDGRSSSQPESVAGDGRSSSQPESVEDGEAVNSITDDDIPF